MDFTLQSTTVLVKNAWVLECTIVQKMNVFCGGEIGLGYMGGLLKQGGCSLPDFWYAKQQQNAGRG
jgi:hypothetical protein